MIHIENSATGTSASSVAYRNVLAEGLLTWSSETQDGFAANALGPQTFDFWTPAAMPATLSVVLVEPVDCEACAIIAHTLGSAGATVHAEGSLTGATWVTVATVTPEDDRDLIMLFQADAPYSYWRILVTVNRRGKLTPYRRAILTPPGGRRSGPEPTDLIML